MVRWPLLIIIVGEENNHMGLLIRILFIFSGCRPSEERASTSP